MAHPVDAFRNIIEHEVAMFVDTTKAFESEVMNNLAKMIRDAFQAELGLIEAGLRRRAPTTEQEYGQFLSPVADIVNAVDNFCRDNWREKDYANHFATVTNAITTLNWIGVQGRRCVDFVRDMKETGDYYGNRVLTANRGNNLHTTWINRWNAIMTALENYVRNFHDGGFTWNVVPVDAPRPPPPPPLLDPVLRVAPEVAYPPPADGAMDSRAALMRDLSQGIDIQRVLRPVRRVVDELAGGDVLPGAEEAPQAPVLPRAQAAVRPRIPVQAPRAPVRDPVFTLEGRKWRIEFQRDAQLQVDPQNNSESLAVFRCENTTIESTAKLNAVTIDNCRRVVINLSPIIASVELIRCNYVEVHCRGACPNISLDYCDSCQIILYDESDHCEVLTAKSSATNICRVNQQGELTEYPVPEQIKSQLVNQRLMNTVVEHLG